MSTTDRPSRHMTLTGVVPPPPWLEVERSRPSSAPELSTGQPVASCTPPVSDGRESTAAAAHLLRLVLDNLPLIALAIVAIRSSAPSRR
ncbi:hypothetical protein ACX9R5_18695 [Rathayibacter sp. CAU 1779]